MHELPATIRWEGGVDGQLVLLDQTKLPTAVEFLNCRTTEDVWQAIKRLSVRGAPAIGIAAAYGVCLSLKHNGDSRTATRAELLTAMTQACDHLATSRPTAVNLFWALDRMRKVAAESNAVTSAELSEELLAEAHRICEEDRRMSAAIAKHGADLLSELPPGAGILTHCNSGALVSSGEGTALAMVFELHRRGRQPHVWVDESRPLLQGARLTAWELTVREIPCTLICDSAAAQVMREGRVQAVVTGADRIAASGDVANKIGTYAVAMLARQHGIPFYVAAPTSTFDLQTASGSDILIEERAAAEVTHAFGHQTAPAGTVVYNPAFDVTPAELVTAIITERGVVAPVNASTVANLMPSVQEFR